MTDAVAVTRPSLLEVMDPSDLLDYALDYRCVLEPAEVISSVDWTLSAAAVSAGVEIHTQSYDDTTATVWLKVASGQQAAVAWNGEGTEIMATCLATTSDGRIRQRAIWVTIKQRNV